MSKADEMFEKLGYEKETDSEEFIGYVHNENLKKVIGFIKPTREIVASRANMSELQAINEKVRELGWNV